MMKRFWQYISAIFAEWKSWLTSSFILAIVGLLLNAIPDITVSLWGWVALMYVGFLIAQFKSFQRVSEQYEKIKASFSEYAYALRVRGIDVQDFRQVDPVTQESNGVRHVRFVINFSNSSSRPIRWEIVKFEVEGEATPRFPTMGGGVGANSTDMFYGPMRPMAIPSAHQVENTRVHMEVNYGPPDGEFVRKLTCHLTYTYLPANGHGSYIYDVNNEVALS